MTYRSPDYSESKYGLDEDLLRTIRVMSQFPLWKVRTWYKGSFLPDRRKCARFIYKYSGFDPESSMDMKKARDYLCDGNLWVSGLDKLNDVHEGASIVAFASDPVVRRKWAESQARKLAKSFPKHDRKKASSDFLKKILRVLSGDAAEMGAAHRRHLARHGVHCFSTDPRNVLMWGLYSAGQTGVCFQLQRAKCLGVLALTHPVTYQSEPVHLTWPHDRERAADPLRTKSLDWKYEAEVRYISSRLYQQSLPFDTRALDGVIVGSRFHESQNRIEALIGILVERISIGLPRPKLYQAAIPNGTYNCRIFRAWQLERDLDAAIALAD